MATTMLSRFFHGSVRVAGVAFRQQTFASTHFRTFSYSANLLAERLYTDKHEWILVEKDNVGKVGISDHAQNSLGDIVYVQLPEIGTTVEKDGEVGCVESVKAASDIYSPVTGEVVEANGSLSDTPDLVNKSPLDQGWIFKLKVVDLSDLESLMNESAYKEFLKSQE